MATEDSVPPIKIKYLQRQDVGESAGDLRVEADGDYDTGERFDIGADDWGF